MSNIIGSIITVAITILISAYTIKQSLSNESGWRSKIFDAASKGYITYREVYTMRTALRYGPKKNPKKFSYDYLTNFAIEYCDYLIEKKRDWEKKLNSEIKPKNTELKLTHVEQEITRIILRCMLKNHWDFNSSMVPSIFKYKSNQDEIKKKHVHEAFLSIDELLRQEESGSYSRLIEILEKYFKSSEDRDVKIEEKTIKFYIFYLIHNFIAVVFSYILLGISVSDDIGKNVLSDLVRSMLYSDYSHINFSSRTYILLLALFIVIGLFIREIVTLIIEKSKKYLDKKTE